MVNSLLGEGETMVSIANWPDHYSDTDEGSWSSCLHYVNIEDQGDHLYWYSRDCGGVGSVDHCCVAASVLNYTVQVGEEVHGKGRRKEKEEEDQQKLLFGKNFLFSGGDSDANLTGEPTPLSFMIHFVGDTHQPLHCGYGCDAGGNFVKVVYDGEAQNFHGVWDYGMINDYCNEDWQSFADELQNRIDNSTFLRPFYSSLMNSTNWVQESYNEYVRHKVYDFSEEGLNSNTGDPVVYPFDDCPISDVITLPDSYYERNIEAIKMRLMAAGIRLAQALNDIASTT